MKRKMRTFLAGAAFVLSPLAIADGEALSGALSVSGTTWDISLNTSLDAATVSCRFERGRHSKSTAIPAVLSFQDDGNFEIAVKNLCGSPVIKGSYQQTDDTILLNSPDELGYVIDNYCGAKTALKGVGKIPPKRYEKSRPVNPDAGAVAKVYEGGLGLSIREYKHYVFRWPKGGKSCKVDFQVTNQYHGKPSQGGPSQ
ncbi:MAG: hypothetical protein AB1648_13885 [Pseudomonadota bacterium]